MMRADAVATQVSAQTRAAPDMIPDFFIVGAMKCGTTTLHHMLARHPQVFIPRHEIFFFDIDDFEQHADFFPHLAGRWSDQDFDGRLPELLGWYRRFFAAATAGQRIGEDSTTYLASEKVPQRIAQLRPDARILVMLRDPAERTYSEYWHLVRHGRAFLSFEDTLSYWPHMLVQRSLYQRQLARYLKVFPREQIHIVLLEDLVREPARVLGDVLTFLNLPADQLPADALRVHSNAGGAPRWPTLRLLRNRWLWKLDSRTMLRHLPDGDPSALSPGAAKWLRRINHLHSRLNPSGGRAPAMKDATRRFLNQYFQRENAGLDVMLNRDLRAVWYRDAVSKP